RVSVGPVRPDPRSGGGGTKLGPAGADRPEPLVQPSPGPRLDPAGPRLPLVAGCPGGLRTRLPPLHHGQLFRLAIVNHPALPQVADGGDARSWTGRITSRLCDELLVKP